MSACLRHSDTVARYGGDEFVSIMTDVTDTVDVNHMAESLGASLRKTIVQQQKEYVLGASIGISLYPEDGKNTDELLLLADAAMYKIKNRGKDSYGFATCADRL